MHSLTIKVGCITALVILFIYTETSAQIKLCGTEVTQAQIDKEKSKKLVQPPAAYAGFAPKYCLRKMLSINAYIIRDSLGNAGVSEAAILGEVNTLNTYFAPICLSFQVCSFTYVDNYNYNFFIRPHDEAELRTLHYVPNTINMYFASVVQKDSGVSVGGYAYFPGGPDFIIISKSSLSSISHEVGHFFGLYHTFETSMGNELANESNCATAGDLICDTPADPNGVAGADCQLANYSMDANGDWYVPQTGNIMSYYSGCDCGFTTMQYNKMAEEYLGSRFYLW